MNPQDPNDSYSELVNKFTLDTLRDKAEHLTARIIHRTETDENKTTKPFQSFYDLQKQINKKIND